MVGLPLRNNNRSLMPSLQVLLLPLACVASAAAATDEQSRQGSRVQQPDDAATTATSQGQEDSRSRRLQEAAGGPSAQAVLLDLKADLEAGWTHNLLESWTAETVSSPLLRHVTCLAALLLAGTAARPRPQEPCDKDSFDKADEGWMYVRCNAPWPDGRPTTLCALHTFGLTPCSRSADLGCASCCSRRCSQVPAELANDHDGPEEGAASLQRGH